MLKIMLCMAVGIVLGRSLKIRNLQKAITVTVWLMLFFIGWEVGGDKSVVAALPAIGLDAVAFSLAGVAGSVAFAWVLWKSIKNKNNGDKGILTEAPQKGDAIRKGLRDSLIVLCFFSAGICLGLFCTNIGNGIAGKLSFWSLCALILMIGMSIGSTPDILTSLKSINPKSGLLPLATIFGTFAGCLIINIFIGYRAADALAIGSGFGYYSLSSIIISESKGLELGAIALISNIIREAFTLLCSPVLVRLAGPLAPIAAGGATTADTTLPIIRSSSGEDFVLLSIFHGFLVDFSVPFLVTFFCSI